MGRSALSKLETGQRANPTIETLVRYAEAVGTRVAKNKHAVEMEIENHNRAG